MKIEVTQDDIDHGEKLNCWECPIARAVKRVFPNEFVSVGASIIFIGDTKRGMPRIVSKFIRDFDMFRPVEPFTFELE